LGEKVELVLFGASKPANQPHLRLNTHYVGKLHDDVSLAMLYAAVDVFVSASLQEAFGLTIAESISCGTPVVAFNTTGPKDIVEHNRNGYLAKPYDVGDLSKGVAWVLGDDKRWQILSQQARQKVEKEFELTHVAQRYLDLYKEILSRR
jgi:glycosyltransferase involved in cell wall biosynthesis